MSGGSLHHGVLTVKEHPKEHSKEQKTGSKSGFENPSCKTVSEIAGKFQENQDTAGSLTDKEILSTGKKYGGKYTTSGLAKIWKLLIRRSYPGKFVEVTQKDSLILSGIQKAVGTKVTGQVLCAVVTKWAKFAEEAKGSHADLGQPPTEPRIPYLRKALSAAVTFSDPVATPLKQPQAVTLVSPAPTQTPTPEEVFITLDDLKDMDNESASN